MDMETFAQRMEALRPRLYRTAYCYLGSEAQALDALDEAVYRALKSLQGLRQPEFFETWLTRILINECTRELKRRRWFQPLEDAETIPEEQLDNMPLQEALRHLPKDLRNVVILRFFSGLTQAETAQVLNLPQGTVATRQRRALQLLKLELEEASV